MNKIVWLSLFLSLLWHSSACILFKIAEPYTSREKKVQIFDVAFVPAEAVDPKSSYEQRFSYNNTDFINTRFTLPGEHSQNMRVPEIKVDFEKKLNPLDPVSGEMLGIVQYSNNRYPMQGENSPYYDKTIEQLGGVDYQPLVPVDNEMETGMQAKYLKFMIKGNMKPIDTVILGEVSEYIVEQPCVVRFSVDRFGSVRYAILDQSSGNTSIDAKLVSILRQIKFSVPLKQSLSHDAIAHDTVWGKIIFYNH